MPNEHATPWINLSESDVEFLVEFSSNNQPLHILQRDGCYRLWNTLCNDQLRFAYLADEVGMGKTYQALGIVGILHYLKPDARVIILCPSDEMQKQWSADWHSFFKEKYCPNGLDGHLKSRRIDAIYGNQVESFESAVQPLCCDNLGQFAASLVASEQSAYLLRYSSFSLPIRLHDWECFKANPAAPVPFKQLVVEYKEIMDNVGYQLSEQELVDLGNACGEMVTLGDANEKLLNFHSKCIAGLVNAFAPDLIVWDEAQYLRTDAGRNISLRTIFGDLHQRGCRHLFLSATPAHRSIDDINQLNHLLHVPSGGMPLIQVKSKEGHGESFRKSVERWMVRRERMFSNRGKLEYRAFVEESIDMFSDKQSALYALTFAPMQKNLVKLLEGQNNRFRMGEISCNESARASISGLISKRRSINENESPTDEKVLEESADTNANGPIDEDYLVGLGSRFRALQADIPQELRRDLPHAKVDRVVDDLATRCLENGSNTKELVFVRRVATVDELADGLLRKFQKSLDSRIRAFGENPNAYWKLSSDQDDGDEEEAEFTELSNADPPIGRISELPYFKALTAVKGQLGRLTKYRNSLGKAETSKIRFLLVPRHEMSIDDTKLWQLLLGALEITDEAYAGFLQDPGKDLLLRRCIAHSIRFTDFLVDLDVIRRLNRTNYVETWLHQLKLPRDELAEYFSNCKKKLQDWIVHFDTIVNKCFKGGGQHNSYSEIAERIATYFRGLTPVARRSGRRTDENVVIQFKFPVSPNVLICTDILREGVNLHLFCERVSHYGIAWNSGDLEQRIGRVERAESLFEREILRNTSHQLPVGFPYLARTLDERQVRKAIRRKQEIDSLFSLFPPSQENGECDDSKEHAAIAIRPGKRFEPLIPKMENWPPNGRNWTAEMRQKQLRWDTALGAAHALAKDFKSNLDNFHYSGCRIVSIVGEHALIAIEWVKFSHNPAWRVCDRHVYGTFGRKTQWKTIRSLYLPMDHTLTHKIITEFWGNSTTQVSGTAPDSLHAGFTYCSKWNTHYREDPVMHPVEGRQPRSQVSLRCRWGTALGIASVVAKIDDQSLSAKDAESLAGKINQALPFGSAVIQNECLLLLFPQVGGHVWKEALTTLIAQKLAHWADRRQWVILRNHGSADDFYNLPTSGISEMKTDLAIQVLNTVKKWCDELNDAIGHSIGHACRWRQTGFDKLVESGSISCASEILAESGVGRFQIAYSYTGMNSSEESKRLIFFLFAKPANSRVVRSEVSDIWDFIKRKSRQDYAEWLGSEYFVQLDEPYFHYALAEHTDGKQYRRLRLVLAAAEFERADRREYWLQTIGTLAIKLLSNDVFQYNAAWTNIQRSLSTSSIDSDIGAS